jgi:hypothetical protein
MTATGLLTQTCNPYGNAGDTGPARLLGGLYGPEHEGRYKWGCTRRAAGRYRMTCTCGHRGQIMPLCTQHVREISKRQSDLCPPCAFPPEAAELQKAAERAQQDMYLYAGFDLIRATAAAREHERCTTRLNELNASGVIHKCRLTLTEIS